MFMIATIWTANSNQIATNDDIGLDDVDVSPSDNVYVQCKNDKLSSLSLHFQII